MVYFVTIFSSAIERADFVDHLQFKVIFLIHFVSDQYILIPQIQKYMIINDVELCK